MHYIHALILGRKFEWQSQSNQKKHFSDFVNKKVPMGQVLHTFRQTTMRMAGSFSYLHVCDGSQLQKFKIQFQKSIGSTEFHCDVSVLFRPFSRRHRMFACFINLWMITPDHTWSHLPAGLHTMTTWENLLPSVTWRKMKSRMLSNCQPDHTC